MARAFDGTADYGTIASSADFNTADCSFSFIANTPTGNGDNDRVIEIGAYPSNDGLTITLDNAASEYEGLSWASGSSTKIGSNASFTADTWQGVGISATTTGPVDKFYFNGSQSGADLTTGSRAAGAQAVGIMTQRNSPGNNLTNGRLADFGFWNVVLTDEEFAMHHAGVCALLIRPESLVRYYPMISNSPDNERSLVGGASIVMTSAPAAYPHPGILHRMPHSIIAPPSGAVAATSFLARRAQRLDRAMQL